MDSFYRALLSHPLTHLEISDMPKSGAQNLLLKKKSITRLVFRGNVPPAVSSSLVFLDLTFANLTSVDKVLPILSHCPHLETLILDENSFRVDELARVISTRHGRLRTISCTNTLFTFQSMQLVQNSLFTALQKNARITDLSIAPFVLGDRVEAHLAANRLLAKNAIVGRISAVHTGPSTFSVTVRDPPFSRWLLGS